MELKKTYKADLTKRKVLFFNIGLVISMAMVVFAFEKRSYDDSNIVLAGQITDDFEDLLDIPLTEQPPPPPPKIQQPELIEVPDEEEIEEEIEVDLDLEITEEEVMADIVFDNEPEEEIADEIFTIVEVSAEPNGGFSSFYKFVKKNMKYPSQARRMDIDGRVFVEFVVDADGSITNVRSIKGIGAGCDEEAVRIIKKHPKWKPARQRGIPVRQRMVLSIVFQLN